MNNQVNISPAEYRFPIGSLSISPLNPRQTVTEGEIEELAESLLTVGLIQNLAGIETPKGVEIVAGGRRLRALKLIAERHPDLEASRIDLFQPLVTMAGNEDTARAWAMAENTARRNLHPAEEVIAYGKMEKAKSSVPAIARSFGVTEFHVRRRLALANLPGPVLDALAADEITLDVAGAFTISNDEARILEALEHVRGRDFSPYWIRQRLKPAAICGASREAVFVGEEAYMAAGGGVTADLFAEKKLFDSPAILEELFREKLEAVTVKRREDEGWKWAEVSIEPYVPYKQIREGDFARVYPVEGILTEEEAARYDELAELAESDVLDEKGAEILQALEDKQAGDYTDDQKAVSGILVYLDSAGTICAEAGLVRPEDKPAAIEAGLIEKSLLTQTTGKKEPSKPAISATLALDLEKIRTGARQTAALRNPDMLLSLLAFQLDGKMPTWRRAIMLNEEPPINTPEKPEGYIPDERITAAKKTPANPVDVDLVKSFSSDAPPAPAPAGRAPALSARPRT